jgi:hypothetical protein
MQKPQIESVKNLSPNKSNNGRHVKTKTIRQNTKNILGRTKKGNTNALLTTYSTSFYLKPSIISIEGIKHEPVG